MNCLAPNVNSARAEAPCSRMQYSIEVRAKPGWVGGRKERTMITKTAFKFPQGPYQICTRVYKTETSNYLCHVVSELLNLHLTRRWHQIPCVFYFFLLLYSQHYQGNLETLHFNCSVSNIYILKNVQQMELYCARLTLP